MSHVEFQLNKIKRFTKKIEFKYLKGETTLIKLLLIRNE